MPEQRISALKIAVLTIFSAFCILPALVAQGEIDTQTRVMFRNESSFSVSINSNGFGLNYRYGIWRDARNQLLYDADFAYIKHPKEEKTIAAYNYITRRYVFGKQNLFWELKGYAGWQKELYRKVDRTGISVRFFYSGGAALGFLKPIYYDIISISGLGEVTFLEPQKFDPSIHQSNIYGRSSFLLGFDELKLVPGLTAKTGLSFEYSERDQIIHALEAGINISAYPRRIPIMAVEKNDFMFFTLVVAYRFGRIIDISEAASAKTWLERRRERKNPDMQFQEF
ncbi:MAG: hypothetical protein JXR52_02910 [Bacteroidales bacterium]|nr:hypothetical protein [Bacteroidales bacterium]MBN2697750.1 hypothetical protein [Bacteroidales bacterium]